MSNHHPGTETLDLYARHIGSREWAEKRRQRLAIDGHRCQTCCHGGELWRLEVHHKTYERLGHEDVERDLITLCCQCHEAVTNVIRCRRYDGKPVAVCFIKDQVSSRKDVSDGMDDRHVPDHGRRPVDHAQRQSRKPAEQGR